MMQSLEKVIPEALNQHIFDKIWNEPLSEYRENIRPLLLTNRSVVGNIFTLLGSMSLPTNDTSYFVYGLSDSDVCMHLQFPAEKWISTSDICNQYDTLIHTYSYRGYMCHKDQVFFRYTRDRKHLYLAITKNMMLAIDAMNSLDDLYFTVYHDSDVKNPIRVHSFHMPTSNNTTTLRDITTAYNNVSDKSQVTIFVNGREYSGSAYTPKASDYVDLIIDENIIGQFEVDLTDANQVCRYYSSKDECFKYVLHIPKSLNPDNKVLTHNTCDMYIRPKNSDDGVKFGLYIHRCADLSIGQITHNDFSIPLYIVDAFRDYLGTQDVVIYTYIRQHEKDNHLLRDKSYIDLLYTHDDDGILYFLRGNTIYPQLSFWSADQLESSVYLSMMFDVPELVTPENMTYYVEGLGYYHVLALICERIISSVVTDTYSGALTYSKPYLYRGYNVLPAIYLNGQKILDTYIDILADTTDTISIMIHDSIKPMVGDVITMVMFLDANSDIIKIHPTNTSRIFDIPRDYFKIYKLIDTTIADNYRGIDVTSSIRYEDVTDQIGLYQIIKSSSGHQIYCGDNMSNNTYVILAEECSYYWSENIDYLVQNGENIVLPLSRYILHTTQHMPIFNFKNESIYLNGKYLVKGLDYYVNTVISPEGDPSFVQLVIQSFEYVQNENNVVEVYLNVAEVEDLSSGFVIHDKIYDMTPANLWFPSISLCHVTGKIEAEAVNMGIHITTPADKHPNGAPFEVQTAVPQVVREFLDKYHVNDDKARLEILNEYFYGRVPDGSNMILIEGSHRLYSVYLNRIIRDIIQHGFKFGLDPEPDRIRLELQDYDYLLAMDKVLSTGIDLNMIDRYPAYQQYTTTIENRNMIKALINIFLPTEEVAAGGDYYE